MEEGCPRPALEDDSNLLQPWRKPWAVEVDVYLDEDDPPKFRISSALPTQKGDSEHPILIFENKGRDGFEIRFYLSDLTEKGYRFPDKVEDAVWSVIGDSECPKSKEHQVLEPLRVKDGTMLVARNENGEKDGEAIGKFRYTLNVSKTGKPPYLPLDPGGVNSDGPRTLRFK